MRMERDGVITRLWLATVSVADMDRALRFYTETLQLPVALHSRRYHHAEVGPAEPLAKIGLHLTGKRSKRKRRTGIVLETRDIDGLYRRLRARGVTFTLNPTKMPWGGIVANFLDPDNNELQVVQDPDHYTRSYDASDDDAAGTAGGAR